MVRRDNTWHSEFPPTPGHDHEIQLNTGILAVTSYDTLTGGHAAFYIEFLTKQGTPEMYKIHLLAGLNGLEELESTGSGSTASSSPGSGSNRIEIQYEKKSFTDADRERRAGLLYQSFVVARDEILAVIKAAKAFEADVVKGKYVYRLPGGLIGRFSTLPGKRGVNCADFCIKVLRDAKIANLKSRLLNTPRTVATRRGGSRGPSTRHK